MALSDNGLFSKTQEAADKYKKAQEDEEFEIEKIEYVADGKDVKELLQISDKEGFEEFRNKVNEGKETFENTLIKLSSDLDLSEETWTPIGTEEHPFNGVFNGNGHKISNLTIDDNAKYQGLFGYNKGIIKNIGVDGNTIKLNKIAGVIAGYSEGIIESCYNKAEITSEDIYFLGGIVGFNEKNGKIRECYNTGKITGTAKEEYCKVSGICGRSTSNTSIISCYNSGEIDVTTNFTNLMVGGITANGDGLIDSCYNVEKLKLSDISNENLAYQAIAGIAGQAGSGSITRCFNVGSIILEGSNNLPRRASILGGIYDPLTIVISDCFMNDNLNKTYSWPGKPEGKEPKFVKEAIKITDDMKATLHEKLGENFIKDNGTNEGYPILKWQK